MITVVVKTDNYWKQTKMGPTKSLKMERFLLTHHMLVTTFPCEISLVVGIPPLRRTFFAPCGAVRRGTCDLCGLVI